MYCDSGISEIDIYEFVKRVSRSDPLSIRLTLDRERVEKGKLNNSKRPKGKRPMNIAYVTFAEDAETLYCAKELNGEELEDQKVKVNFIADVDYRKKEYLPTGWIKVDNLNRDVQEKELMQHITDKGIRIRKMELIHNVENADKTGYAFIECYTEQDAMQIVEALHLTELNTRTLWVCHCGSRKTETDRIVIAPRDPKIREKFKRVYVSNLHWSVTKQDIIDKASIYGEVEQIRRPVSGGYPTNWAVIRMKTHDGAKAVLEEFHGKTLGENSNMKMSTTFTKMKGTGNTKKKGSKQNQSKRRKFVKSKTLQKAKSKERRGGAGKLNAGKDSLTKRLSKINLSSAGKTGPKLA